MIDFDELKKGDFLISKSSRTKVKFFSESYLDRDCFIGEDLDGDVYDDFKKEEFILEE